MGLNPRLLVVVLLLALAAYALGLGGQYIPTNGDELVYIHIARLTAESGHWLPLVSDLPQMRNTKPPLLFWQALVAGGRGETWTLWALRLPSLLYTAATAALVAWAVWACKRETWRALLAACVYLAFFSSFRYGRPYLTSAPETFWLCLPLFVLWAWALRPAPPRPGWRALSLATLFAGLAWGLGLLYKSFALIAPTAAAFWLALAGLLWLAADAPSWAARLRTRWQALVGVSLGVGLAAAVALALFGLWFVIDPDPRAVWQEFVIGENAGKMGDKLGWWHEAVHGGGSSLWAQALAYLENAGLLFPLVIGLAAALWPLRRAFGRGVADGLQRGAWILLAWLLVWWLVFLLPSQRSARYLIPAMPALAIALALAWERLHRAWFVAAAGLTALFALLLARIGWVMADMGIATSGEATALGLALAATFGCVAATCIWRRSGPTAGLTCLVAVLLLYLSFGLLTSPLDGPQGRYNAAVQESLRGKSVATPSNFNAQWERFGFLLPGSRVTPFDMADVLKPDAAELLARRLQAFDTVVWMGVDARQKVPPCAQAATPCRVLAQRWIVRERHRAGEITPENLWRPQEWLFTREWVLARA